jgi:ribonuclease HI
VEEDLMRMKVRNWREREREREREKCKERRLWNEILKQAKTHRGL